MKAIIEKGTYSVKDIGNLTGKSDNLIYRRLTETPRKYTVRFARKEGKTWVFNRILVDEAIQRGESIIIPVEAPDFIDENTAIHYFSGRVKGSCGKA